MITFVAVAVAVAVVVIVIVVVVVVVDATDSVLFSLPSSVMDLL